MKTHLGFVMVLRVVGNASVWLMCLFVMTIIFWIQGFCWGKVLRCLSLLSSEVLLQLTVGIDLSKLPIISTLHICGSGAQCNSRTILWQTNSIPYKRQLACFAVLNHLLESNCMEGSIWIVGKNKVQIWNALWIVWASNNYAIFE